MRTANWRKCRRRGQRLIFELQLLQAETSGFKSKIASRQVIDRVSLRDVDFNVQSEERMR